MYSIVDCIARSARRTAEGSPSPYKAFGGLARTREEQTTPTPSGICQASIRQRARKRETARVPYLSNSLRHSPPYPPFVYIVQLPSSHLSHLFSKCHPAQSSREHYSPAPHAVSDPHPASSDPSPTPPALSTPTPPPTTSLSPTTPVTSPPQCPKKASTTSARTFHPSLALRLALAATWARARKSQKRANRRNLN